MIVFVDTSALFALLDEDDEHHLEAVLTFRAVAPDATFVTHSYVLVEANELVRRRLGQAALQRLTDELVPAMETTWVDQSLHREGVAAQRAGPGRSLVDHVSFALMRRQGIESAFAYDVDFELEGFRLLPPPHRLAEEPAPYDESPRADQFADLVSVSEIASRAGRPINTIQSWRRRHTDFPRPLAHLAAGPIWAWPAVEDWIVARGRTRASSSVGPA